MALGSGSGSGGLQADMTPLIDVLLVLLIIFMVIVPMMPRGLDAQVPRPAKKASKSDAIVVQVLADRDGRVSYKINQEDVAIQEMGNRLNVIFFFGRGSGAVYQGGWRIGFFGGGEGDGYWEGCGGGPGGADNA